MTISSFTPALSGGQYTQLRLPHWQADQNISLCDNVVVFAASMASTQPPVSGTTTAHLPYTTVTVGSYTDIQEGMVCIVSPTSDPRYPTAVRLRVRLDGDAGVVADTTNVYVSEYSDILGLGAHIFVYYAYDVIDNLSRPVGTNPVVQYVDYNQPFQLMAPVAVGMQTAYANWCDASGFYTIAFDVSASFAANLGATISSFAFSVTPTGGGTATVTAGDPATDNVTYQFTAGEYWLSLVITDSNGVTTYRRVLIKAHDDSYPPNEGFEGVEIQRDINQGPSARVKFYDGVDSLLNGTEAVLWVSEYTSDGDLTSGTTDNIAGNIDLVGWIETQDNQFQTDPTYSAYAEIQFEIQGVAARLTRMEAQLLAFTNSASPTLWDQISTLTPARAAIHFLQRHTQALHLCDFTTDDLTATFKFPTITTIGQNALETVTGSQGFGEQINTQLEFARDGRIQFVRKANFVASYQTELTTVATWTDQDIVGQFSIKNNYYLNYGYLDADGAAWDGSAPTPLPVLSRAPGLAQSSGADQGKLNNQILTLTASPAGAQAELNERAGTQYAILNNTMELTWTHPDNYWWLETSFNQLYLFDLSASDFANGEDLSAFYWVLKSITVSHDNEKGARTVQATYVPVATGFPGATVPIVNSGSVTQPINLPPMPAFAFELPEATIPDTGFTSSTKVVPTTDRSGQIVLEVGDSGAGLYITQNYILLAKPTWRAYTPPLPSGYSLTDACFDQLGSTGGAVAVYALGNNGTDSIIFYNPNVVDGTSAWQQTGTPFTGVYTQLRAAGTAGGVLVYSSSPSQGTIVYDFTASDGGWSPVSVGTPPPGNWVMSSGWEPVDNTDGSNRRRIVDISVTIPSSTVIKITFTYNLTKGTYTADDTALEISNGTTGISQPASQLSNGTDLVAVWEGSQAGVTNVRVRISSSYDDTTNSWSGSCLISQATIVTGTGNGGVRYSSDYGSTVGSALDLGSAPGGEGGFDLARVNGVSYAAASNALMKASTLGGSYSSLASLSATPVSACIPYYEVGSNTTSQTTSSSPQVMVGYGTVVSGTCIAWINGTGTVTPITNPVSGAVFDLPDCITMLRGKKVAIIVNVGGTRKLYVTEDLVAGGTCTWTFVENVGANATLRSRRNDPRNAAHKGQLYTFDDTSGYSSRWAFASEWDRLGATSNVLSGDVLG